MTRALLVAAAFTAELVIGGPNRASADPFNSLDTLEERVMRHKTADVGNARDTSCNPACEDGEECRCECEYERCTGDDVPKPCNPCDCWCE